MDQLNSFDEFYSYENPNQFGQQKETVSDYNSADYQKSLQRINSISSQGSVDGLPIVDNTKSAIKARKKLEPKLDKLLLLKNFI